ncbi:fructose-bisphosphate aldolase domain protein [Mycobacterium ulcerans str. Harvey]|uniref:Fructose-bisphosphate aldolase domain protein n=1 Tax=Mycobacterium ulcerans str. Harvey TaxID=1299332 RepID=A0ABN0R9D8_MYCUL|nr:fructose-bisphosphate aldolase domain protein [Mycobacterium ulcerans str. Harvey]
MSTPHPVRVQPTDRRHIFTNYDGVLKVDGEVGNKKVYDPRSYLKKAEAGETERVIEACNDLHCAGKSLAG